MGEAGGSVYCGALSTVVGTYTFMANKAVYMAPGAADDFGSDEP